MYMTLQDVLLFAGGQDARNCIYNPTLMKTVRRIAR